MIVILETIPVAFAAPMKLALITPIIWALCHASNFAPVTARSIEKFIAASTDLQFLGFVGINIHARHLKTEIPASWENIREFIRSPNGHLAQIIFWQLAVVAWRFGWIMHHLHQIRDFVSSSYWD